jgi:hypothetical protein
MPGFYEFLLGNNISYFNSKPSFKPKLADNPGFSPNLALA